MNTVGTGTGIGGSNSENSCLYINKSDPITETSSGNISGTYTYKTDFAYYSGLKPADDPMRKYRYCGPQSFNAPNNYESIDNAIWINNNPYFWISDYTWSRYYEKPRGYASVRESSTLYKFNINANSHDKSTYTKIPFPASTNTCTIRNESLIMDDKLIIICSDSSNNSDSDYGYGGIRTYGMKLYMYSDITGLFTEIIDMAALSKNLGMAFLNKSSTYAYCWNAYLYENELILIVNNSSGSNLRMISINLKTTESSVKCTNVGSYYSKNQILSGLSVLIKDTLYSMVPQYGDNGWAYEVAYLEKYKLSISSTNITYTVLSSDVLGSADTNDRFYGTLPDYFMTILTKQGSDHYMFGLAIVDHKDEGPADVIIDGEKDYSGTLYVHKNTMDVYVDENGSIVEYKPFQTLTKFNRWQSVLYVKYGCWSVNAMQWNSCLAFHYDPIKQTFGLIASVFGINSSGINVWYVPCSSVCTVSFKTTDLQTLTGQLCKGDIIYTSGTITSVIEAGIEKTMNVRKYVVANDGNTSITIASKNGNYPSTVITDSGGNIIYMDIEPVLTETDKYRWSPITGMYVNDTKITSSTRNQILDVSSYTRMYISMKGV